MHTKLNMYNKGILKTKFQEQIINTICVAKSCENVVNKMKFR